MTFFRIFCQKLAQHLESQNLIPLRMVYDTTSFEIYRIGEKEIKTIKQVVPRRFWKLLLDELGKHNAEGQCKRILGFGHQLSEFIIAPLSIPPDQKEIVCHLGSLTNFIVAIYDHFLDTSKVESNPIPFWLLKLSLSELGRLLIKFLLPFLSNYSQIMMRLVSHYFKELDHIVIHSNNYSTKRLIYKTIYKMYQAEQSFIPLNYTSTIQWKRKSGLPFVVMVLPVLLVARPSASFSTFGFIRRIYRFGEVFGLIDDIVDLQEDKQTQQPNLIGQHLQEQGDKEKVAEYFSQRIKEIFVEIYSRWDSIYVEQRETASNMRWIPIICLISWLGGLSVFAPFLSSKH